MSFFDLKKQLALFLILLTQANFLYAAPTNFTTAGTGTFQVSRGVIYPSNTPFITGISGTPSPALTTPYTYNVTGPALLPSGLRLATNGTISGVTCDAQGGTPGVDVTATGANSATFVENIPLNITAAQTGGCSLIFSTTGPTPTGITSTVYSSSVSITGGTGTVTYTLNSGSLPTGLTLNSDGTITGTPTAVGVYSFTVLAVDSTGNGLSSTYTISVTAPAPATISGFTPTGGTNGGGTTVIITGTNFSGASDVTIAGVTAASFTVLSPTSISAVTGATGDVPSGVVTVTTPSGSVSSSGSYTYSATTPPTVTAINPASGTTVGNTSVTITGTNLAGATAVTIGGVAVGGTISVNGGGQPLPVSPPQLGWQGRRAWS